MTAADVRAGVVLDLLERAGDQEATLLADVQAIRSWPFLPSTLAVGGFRYDVDTGLLTQIC